jgi:hypothetical protein
MEEWDQRRAESRSIEEMRQIALDALQFGDDDEAFYTYAARHNLTVDEVVYYLNAYEAGGDVGLQAIRAPDIIPQAGDRLLLNDHHPFVIPQGGALRRLRRLAGQRRPGGHRPRPGA